MRFVIIFITLVGSLYPTMAPAEPSIGLYVSFSSPNRETVGLVLQKTKLLPPSADTNELFSYLKNAQTPPPSQSKPSKFNKYKIWPGIQSVLFGPRIGLEANEGKPVTFIEKANLFVPIVPFLAYQENGIKGFMTSAFICPRAGMELKVRKIRTSEWFGLIPIVGASVHLILTHHSRTYVITEAVSAGILSRLLPAYEALRGKTMTEIEKKERIKR